MRLLFVHQNFPGQYRHLASYFARSREHSVVAIGEAPKLARIEGRAGSIRCLPYAAPKLPSQRVHRYLRGTELAVRRAEQVKDVAKALKGEGFIPDIICVHPGWGDALFLKDVFPDSPILGFFEFFYSAAGADVGFDPEAPSSEDDAYRLRIKNTVNLHSMEICDWGVTPTRWQLAQFPRRWRDRISVIFDGIDTKLVKPNPGIGMRLEGKNLQLTRAHEVITFVNRNLEPYRGFHIFMRSLPRLLRERPRAHVLIVGGDEISYGQPPGGGRTWRQVMLEEVGGALDQSRVHFLGRLPYSKFVGMLQLSSVHVYLTYPFVLSWSLIEAMSAGCLVVGSATAPVQEVIEDGVNGLLVDFFAPDRIVDAIHRVLDHRTRMQGLRDAARRTVVDRYDLATVCLPRQVELVERVAARIRPTDRLNPLPVSGAEPGR
jgi:glycosyltransferase involved in cell wall biosynthesis